jgi:hypothetical protein
LYQDSNFCFLKDFPHSNTILIQFSLNNLESNIEDNLPCTCSIYWLYKDFFINTTSLKEFSSDILHKLPMHCFNINSLLIQEQFKSCDFDIKTKKCDNNFFTDGTSMTSSTGTNKPKSCFFDSILNSQYCTCKFDTFISVLECSNPLLTETLSSYKSDHRWNYVTFQGSSIQKFQPNSFKNLRLASNATLLLDRVQLLDDIFLNDTEYDNQFRLIIQNSDLNNLQIKFPFRYTNFSSLEFNYCKFSNLIFNRAFEGSNIDRLVIRRSNQESLAPYFQQNYLKTIPSIKRFELLDVYDIFRNNSEYGLILDNSLLNNVLFNDLEELKIKNTFLDSIDNFPFEKLDKLRIVHFENVNLKKVVENFYDQNLFGDQGSDFETTNWLSKIKSGKIFLGHEFYNQFKFENEYLCYFLNISEQVTLYIYDNLDSPNGVECTCSLYMIYRNLDFENLNQIHGSENLRLIPNCIQKLSSQQNLNRELDKCFKDSTDPLNYCKKLYFNRVSTIKVTTNTSLSTISSETTTGLTNPTNRTQETTSKNRLDSLFTNTIVLIVIGVVLIVMVMLVLIVLIKLLKKLKKYEYIVKIAEEKKPNNSEIMMEKF